MNENMSIQLVEPDAMRTGRGGGKRGKGEKYAKYKVAIQKIAPFLKENIEKKETIRVKTDDLKKEMGGEFATKHATSVYWGLKYTLFNEGIWVTTGKHTDGSDVLVMREATPDDKLPDSLTKGGVKGDSGNGGDGGEEDLPDIDEDENSEEDK